MDWDAITRWALAAFGLVGLCLMLLTGLFRQLPELIRAMQEAREAMRGRSQGNND
ncbi:hypothetical protein [Streptomyces sp. V3I7]|uniref:hypothetical protein n=1 Tax=Streptomyces sp. V3I7 TaxID=3042278 RepID=UPI00278A2B9A|nr:hypothetical protein [Streptomyces sp. V3I7]MDQ0990745.1 hypothetical protein [Streptomyces sp. V3I7]